MLFNIIIFAVVIWYIVKKAKGNNNKGQVNRTNQQVYQQRMNEYKAAQQVKPVTPQNVYRTSQPGAYQNSGAYQDNKNKQNKYVQNNTDIVARAKGNTNKLKEDTTLKELEKAHKHVERQQKKPVEHSEACQVHNGNNTNIIVPEESVLGSIEDLMVKGYDGNLQFERDFIGEALDMVANFSIQNTKIMDVDFDNLKKGA